MSTSLVGTLRGLRGNARACVYTEPLWGIPFSLFSPYISSYMLALGLNDGQVGCVTSVALAGQIVFSVLSGAIPDTLVLKRATLVFDILAWSIPCLLWASAQNLAWFLAGGLVNSLRRVPDNSWNCLLVEDTEPGDLVHIYAWVYIAGQLSAFFAPLAGLLISHYTLVPTVRGLYLLAGILMTAKFLILNAYAVETKQGQVRMEATRGQSVAALLGEYRGVAREILASPQTLYTIALMVIISITTMVQTTFWSILATERIRIPAGHIAMFPFARSLMMLFVLFLVVPRLQGRRFGRPMLTSFALYLAGQILLVCIPTRGYALLLVSALLESGSYAVLATQIERLAVINVDPRERARIISIAHVVVIACTTPFGWIAGLLSQASRINPFLLNMILVSMGMVAVWQLQRFRIAEEGSQRKAG